MRAIVLTVTLLLQCGIPASTIGIITLYNSQWARLKSEIGSLMTHRGGQLDSQRPRERNRVAHQTERCSLR